MTTGDLFRNAQHETAVKKQTELVGGVSHDMPLDGVEINQEQA